MIDFRYHIVSIVAVFLALGIGLLMGSGVLGDPLLENIRDRARDVQDFNDRLKDDVVDLEQELAVARRFAETVAPILIDDRLEGDDVVIVDVAAGALSLDTLMEALEEDAGATVASIVTLSDDFDLTSEEDYEELRELTGGTAADADGLRVAAARQLGNRIATLAGARRGQPQRALAFLRDLEAAGFVDVAEEDEATPVPQGAKVVIVASGSSEPTFRVDLMVAALAEAAAAAPGPVVVVEATESAWDVAGSIRGDGDLANLVGTVDNVDKFSGRIALAMALERPAGEEAGHFGEKSGASSVIPEPGLRD